MTTNERKQPSRTGPEFSRRKFLVGSSIMGLVASLPTALTRAANPGHAAASIQPDLKRIVGATYRRNPATNPADLSLAEAAYLLRERQLTSLELVNACLARIAERDPILGAWVRVYRDDAIAQAMEADRILNLRAQNTSILTGIPIGIKDLIAVKDKPLTGGSGVLAGHIAPGDAPAWSQLRAAGMVLLGHTTTLEFGLGDAAPQTVKNPWDLTRSPAGSSNGSGVALCARMLPAALGTDGAGSTRRPASALGICGMIGTWGRVPVRGLITSARTYDRIAPMARSAVDLSLLLSSMCGPDPLDPGTLIAPPVDGSLPYFPRPGSRPLEDVRFGILRGDSFGDLAPGVEAVFTRFQQELASLGATVRDVAAPVADGPYLVFPFPESILLHREYYANNPDGYSAPIRQKIAVEQQLATRPTALDDAVAAQFRADYIVKWKALFRDNSVDFLLAPSINVEVPRLADGEQFGNVNIRREFNVVGFPAFSVPAGFSPDTSMPVGIQIVGDHWTDAGVIQAAIDYQAHTDYHKAVPGQYL